MKKFFWRAALLAGGAMILVGCGGPNKETKTALDKANDLVKQKQYADANTILVDALQARETKIKADAGNPTEADAVDALEKKVQADPEILKMERAWVGLYLRWNRTDKALEVYGDILAGDPDDTCMNDFLGDPDKEIRQRAVQVLDLAADPKSPNLDKMIDTLTAALKDSEPSVRAAAVDALGATKSPRVIQPVVGELKDSDWNTRFEAVGALSRIQDERVIAPLLDATADSDTTVSSSAHENLEHIASRDNTFAKPDDFAARLNDPNPAIARAAAECLGLMRDPRALPILLKLVASSDTEAKVDAVKGLGAEGDHSALPALRQFITDPDLNLRGWSIIGLGRMKDADSLIDLENIANDDAQPETIRQAAAAAVEEIRSTLPQPVTP